jgi:hypothetical protein
MKPRRVDPLAMVLADIAGWPEPSDQVRPKATMTGRRAKLPKKEMPIAA